VDYLDLGHPFDLARQRWVAEAAARALEAGYREKVRLALTIPVSAAVSADGFDRHLRAQLEWLQADYADLCVIGRIDRDNWPTVRASGALRRAEAALTAGKIGCLGFSFHDHYHILKQVLEDYRGWTFCQFQYSYMDTGHDPGTMGLSLAADHGLAVVVTEPLKGGRLTAQPPAAVRHVWEAAPRQRSLAAWGLGFVWNQPAVSTAVCGIETMDQLVEDLVLADEAEAGAFTVRDELTVNRVRDAYNAGKAIACASCRPCMPCPEGIDIPRIFEIYNDAFIYGDAQTASAIYHDEGHRAGDCIRCGLCERACAMSPPIPIMEWLERAGELLERE
jgi:predicted aldo/keto reductase-like oxidoreductase